MSCSDALHVDKRRRTYSRLISEIHHALNAALTEEQKRRGLTRAEMAKLLGKNRSFVTRKLSGASNMTLETLADLAFALDRPVKVSLPARNLRPGLNQVVGSRVASRASGLTATATTAVSAVGKAMTMTTAT